jgi:hypothetical protein
LCAGHDNRRPARAGPFHKRIDENDHGTVEGQWRILMHEYDAALKITLQRVDVAIRDLVGSAVTRWHNIEFPKVESRRADLLGETETGELAHTELQSTNDEDMPRRMLNYYIDVRKKFGRYPQQVLLYVGDEPPRMETALQGPNLDYSYRLIDVRDLDGERLLKSDRVDDNVIALLTRLSDRRRVAQLVLQQIAVLAPPGREEAFERLLILAGLRKALGTIVEEEARNMPVLNDILDHEVLGREYKRGLQQGELKLLRGQIEKRFGPLPSAAEERLSKLTSAQLEDLGVRLLDAKTLDELFQ